MTATLRTRARHDVTVASDDSPGRHREAFPARTSNTSRWNAQALVAPMGRPCCRDRDGKYHTVWATPGTSRAAPSAPCPYSGDHYKGQATSGYGTNKGTGGWMDTWSSWSLDGHTASTGAFSNEAVWSIDYNNKDNSLEVGFNVGTEADTSIYLGRHQFVGVCEQHAAGRKASLPPTAIRKVVATVRRIG